MKAWSDFAVDHPLIVTMATLFVTIVGIYAVLKIPIERDPEITIPYVVVTVPWPGAAPADVEREIAERLEKKLIGLEGVDWVSTASSEGVCRCSIRFLDGVDTKQAKRDVKDRVDQVRNDFPPDAEEPIVWDIRLDEVPVVLVTVTGADLVTLKDIAKRLGDRIETVPGISEVTIYGGLDPEIRVECDPLKLAAYGVTIDDVEAAVRAWHLTFPGGKTELHPPTVNVGRTEPAGSTTTTADTAAKTTTASGAPRDYLVRVLGEVERPESLASIPIASPTTGLSFALSEVATIVPGFKEPTSFSRFGGEPCVTCVVFRQRAVNTVATVAAVKDVVRDFERMLPQGVTVHATQDIGKEIRTLMSQLGSSAFYGSMLVFVVLVLAVGWRNALLVAIAIPFTVLCTVIVMLLVGHTLNAVTIFGMIIILGLVVDGAVIVGENIFRHIEEGMNTTEAAKVGIHEVGNSIIAADLTTIAAFFPLVFLSDSTGQYMSPIPVVVALALAASIVVDHLVLPAFSARLMQKWNVTDITKAQTARAWRMLGWLIPERTRRRLESPPLSDSARTPALPHSASVSDSAVSSSSSSSASSSSTPPPLPPTGTGGGGVGPHARVKRTGMTAWRRFRQGGSGSPVLRFSRRVYMTLLSACIRLRYLVFAVVIAAVALGITGLFAGVVGMELVPHVDRSRFYVRVEMPVGSPLSETSAALREIEAAVNDLMQDAQTPLAGSDRPRGREVETFVTTAGETNSLMSDIRETGESGAEFGKVQVELVEIKDRQREQFTILSDLQKRISHMPGVRVSVEEIYEGPPAGKPIAIRLLGDRYDELAAAAQELVGILRRTPGTRDVTSDYKPSKPELWVSIDRTRADTMQVPSVTVAKAVRAAYYGIEAASMEIGEDDVPIMVQLAPDTRTHAEGLRSIPVRDLRGHVLPLGEVARVEVGTGANKLNRRDGRRTIVVRSDIEPGASIFAIESHIRREAAQSDALARVGARFADQTAPDMRVQLRFEGETQARDNTFTELLVCMALGFLLVSFILTAYLNSLVQAGMLMATVPLGFVGVMIGLILTGNTFNTLSFIGIVALTGIVVNDAVVLLDYTNYLRRIEPQLPFREVVLKAAQTRLRPVFVTTITTIGGLLPLAMNWGGGGRFWEPLAWAIIFGVGAATFLTLIVLPVLYDFLLNPTHGFRADLGWLFGRRHSASK